MQYSFHNKYMRYLQAQKELVRQLRHDGLSLNQIYTKTSIPRTTIRTWITDIKLSKSQLSFLNNHVQKVLQAGRIKAQRIQKKNRIRNEKKLLLKGKRQIGKLSLREFLLAGISLYWAEGFKNKHEHRLGFCNSDPMMIKFYIKWLQKCLKVQKEDIILRLTLNRSYKHKTEEIERYWSALIEVPTSQFTKPFYQKTTWKKEFESDNYHGVLRIHVKGSLNYLLTMRGWIEGLKFGTISDDAPG